MTEDDPTLDEISEIAERIAAVRSEAKQTVDDLIAKRNRLSVAYATKHARSITATARAARVSRQLVDGLVRAARERDDQH